MVKQIQLSDKQMDRFTRDDMDRLLAPRSGPCTSLFMPSERRGTETKGNPIRLKNLIDQAEEKLGRLGMKMTESREFLEPVRARLTDAWFWSHQSAGLAVFVAPGEFYSWRLPLAFSDHVEVGGQFSIRPLAPLLTGDGVFYILALAKGGSRLLEGVRYNFGEVELPGVTTSLPEELRYSIFDIGLQHHTASLSNGGAFGLFHGHGATSDGAILKDRVMEFCRHLDDGVCEALAGQRAPLVLAGVEYIRGFYREASHYPHIIEEGINASPDQMRDEELHRRAWEIVQPLFMQERQAALDLYRQRAGAGEGKVAHNVQAIVPAAVFKRVDTLFVPHGAHAWGLYDAHENRVRIHKGWHPGDVDLVDMAVAHTLRNQGTVYCLNPEEMPEKTDLAAILRF